MENLEKSWKSWKEKRIGWWQVRLPTERQIGLKLHLHKGNTKSFWLSIMNKFETVFFNLYADPYNISTIFIV